MLDDDLAVAGFVLVWLLAVGVLVADAIVWRVRRAAYAETRSADVD